MILLACFWKGFSLLRVLPALSMESLSRNLSCLGKLAFSARFSSSLVPRLCRSTRLGDLVGGSVISDQFDISAFQQLRTPPLPCLSFPCKVISSLMHPARRPRIIADYCSFEHSSAQKLRIFLWRMNASELRSITGHKARPSSANFVIDGRVKPCSRGLRVLRIGVRVTILISKSRNSFCQEMKSLHVQAFTDFRTHEIEFSWRSASTEQWYVPRSLTENTGIHFGLKWKVSLATTFAGTTQLQKKELEHNISTWGAQKLSRILPGIVASYCLWPTVRQPKKDG